MMYKKLINIYNKTETCLEGGEAGRPEGGVRGGCKIFRILKGRATMLFTPALLIAGAATVVLAAIDKTLESYGFHALGTIVKLALPIAAFAAGVYFIETNALIGWLK